MPNSFKHALKIASPEAEFIISMIQQINTIEETLRLVIMPKLISLRFILVTQIFSGFESIVTADINANSSRTLRIQRFMHPFVRLELT